MSQVAKQGALAFALLTVVLTTAAWASPQIGAHIPTFEVDDITGRTHTQQDLAGRWTVILAMTVQDGGDSIQAWYRRLEPVVPPHTQMLTFAAIHLFELIPTSIVMSSARDQTPHNRWTEVWISRNGSLASAWGMTSSDLPWIIVVDPTGHIVEAIHALANDNGVSRVAAAFHHADPPPAEVHAPPPAP